MEERETVTEITLTKTSEVTICFGSKVSTSGSAIACFPMQLILKPYTLFQTGRRNIVPTETVKSL